MEVPVASTGGPAFLNSSSRSRSVARLPGVFTETHKETKSPKTKITTTEIQLERARQNKARALARKRQRQHGKNASVPPATKKQREQGEEFAGAECGKVLSGKKGGDSQQPPPQRTGFGTGDLGTARQLAKQLGLLRKGGRAKREEGETCAAPKLVRQTQAAPPAYKYSILLDFESTCWEKVGSTLSDKQALCRRRVRACVCAFTSACAIVGTCCFHLYCCSPQQLTPRPTTQTPLIVHSVFIPTGRYRR